MFEPRGADVSYDITPGAEDHDSAVPRIQDVNVATGVSRNSNGLHQVLNPGSAGPEPPHVVDVVGDLHPERTAFDWPTEDDDAQLHVARFRGNEN